MKTLILKRPETNRSFAGELTPSTQREADTGSQLYESWGDHPHAFRPMRRTEPCIPCCTV